ncbi:hypothetical protein EA142_14890, partial [Citrobacter freundii]
VIDVMNNSNVYLVSVGRLRVFNNWRIFIQLMPVKTTWLKSQPNHILTATLIQVANIGRSHANSF